MGAGACCYAFHPSPALPNPTHHDLGHNQPQGWDDWRLLSAVSCLMSLRGWVGSCLLDPLHLPIGSRTGLRRCSTSHFPSNADRSPCAQHKASFFTASHTSQTEAMLEQKPSSAVTHKAEDQRAQQVGPIYPDTGSTSRQTKADNKNIYTWQRPSHIYDP